MVEKKEKYIYFYNLCNRYNLINVNDLKANSVLFLQESTNLNRDLID